VPSGRRVIKRYIMIYAVYARYGLYVRIICVTRILRTKGFLRRTVVHLRTRGPYRR